MKTQGKQNFKASVMGNDSVVKSHFKEKMQLGSWSAQNWDERHLYRNVKTYFQGQLCSF